MRILNRCGSAAELASDTQAGYEHTSTTINGAGYLG